MKREELKAMGLTDEQVESVMAKNGAEVAALNTQITTLQSEKSQLENDKKVITKEKEDKEKAIADLQKNSISKDEYDKKIKEIEENAKKENEDYIMDEKSKAVSLTDEGSRKAEEHFHLDNLYNINNTALVHHINQALKANYAMSLDVDYVVQDGEVVIVDQFTGRLMKGRAFSDGLHQAIEAKEGVKIQQETKTLATITFQNYFRMYHKLSGMTGTAKTEEEEFRNIYNMFVIQIPTNKPVIREDATDLLYPGKEGKYNAIVREIERRHAAGQPVLVGTIAIETSELLSKMLTKKKIPHENVMAFISEVPGVATVEEL